jgi:CRISPR-associated protein Cst2
MTMHLFGAVLTAKATAANNRGENEAGTISTLQKIIRNGELHSTVSAEAIRYALREVWQEDDSLKLHRRVSHTGSVWDGDANFEQWSDNIDDDVLGFMHAKKETISRRGILEISRAVSTTPWTGELSYNFASPGANPAVTHKNPIPYAVEEHHTRYQYGFAMTPDELSKDRPLRVEKTLRALQNLRRVGGNHARFLFDFSPEIIVLRWTADPAPRMLLCFDEDERGSISLMRLAARVGGKDTDPEEKDIRPDELIIGSVIKDAEGLKELKEAGAQVYDDGIKKAVSEAVNTVKRSFESGGTVS